MSTRGWIARVRELRQGLEVACRCANDSYAKGGCFACVRLARDDRMAEKFGLPKVKTLRPTSRRRDSR